MNIENFGRSFPLNALKPNQVGYQNITTVSALVATLNVISHSLGIPLSQCKKTGPRVEREQSVLY